MIDLGVFTDISDNTNSGDEMHLNDLSENISIYWDQSILDEAEEESVNEYLESILSVNDIEHALDDINQWLSDLDDIEERWGDVDKSELELRVSRLEQPGSYSDDVFLAVDLDSLYVVNERDLLEDSDCYIIDLSAGGTSCGVPEAEKVASIDYSSF